MVDFHSEEEQKYRRLLHYIGLLTDLSISGYEKAIEHRSEGDKQMLLYFKDLEEKREELHKLIQIKRVELAKHLKFL